MFEQDRIIDGEVRWQVLGKITGKVMLMVAHSIQHAEDEQELIRIICSRSYSKGEEAL